MTHDTIRIETHDGHPDAHVFRPDAARDARRLPGVLMLMDGLGIRPALFEVAERIAAGGYFVLLPDLFYRVGPYVAPDPKKLFADPEVRAAWTKTMATAVTPAGVRDDVKAFLGHMSASADVAGPPFGVTGYCMGGRFALCTAGWFPEQIACAAAFHPGRVVTDEPESAHRVAASITGRVYVARATEDPTFTDDDLRTLEQALADARVDHVIETYPAKHGWVPADTPAHDDAQAKRHYDALERLLRETLRAGDA